MPIDMSTVTAPPKKSTANRTGSRQPVSRVPVQQSKNEIRQHGLMGLAQAGQAIAIISGNYADAATIGQYGPPLTVELANLADAYAWMAGPIDLLIQIGPFSGLLAVAIPMGLQLMANHGAVDASRLAGQGVVPPGQLEAQMKARVLQQQADAMAAQMQAAEQARRAQQRLDEMMATASGLNEAQAVMNEAMANA